MKQRKDKDIMNSFNLDSLDVVLTLDTTSNEFKEFCENLDQIRILGDVELYVEAMNDKNNTGAHEGFKKAMRNTASTTRDLGSAYNTITTSSGDAIKSFWDLMMKALSLTTRVLAYVINKIARIPNAILNIGNRASNIPKDIRDKIRGNIKLYITVNDLSALYNNSLLQRIETFLSLGMRLSEGDMWGTFIKRRPPSGVFKVKENDMKICREMDKVYEHLRLIEFTQTSIEMNEVNRNIYFGTEKSITIKDLHAKTFTGSYYDILHKLMNDINFWKRILAKMHADIGDKYTRSQENQQFSHLDTFSQQRVSQTIQMISKVVGLVGNLVRYVQSDLNTIESSVDKILSAEGVNVTKTDKVAKEQIKKEK